MASKQKEKKAVRTYKPENVALTCEVCGTVSWHLRGDGRVECKNGHVFSDIAWCSHDGHGMK